MCRWAKLPKSIYNYIFQTVHILSGVQNITQQHINHEFLQGVLRPGWLDSNDSTYEDFVAWSMYLREKLLHPVVYCGM